MTSTQPFLLSKKMSSESGGQGASSSIAPVLSWITMSLGGRRLPTKMRWFTASTAIGKLRADFRSLEVH